MNITSYEEYQEEQKEFLAKRLEKGLSMNLTTSELFGDTYSKTKSFEDGSTWWEVIRKKTVYQDVEIKKAIVQVKVEMQEVEYWNTDCSESKYWYEKY